MGSMDVDRAKYGECTRKRRYEVQQKQKRCPQVWRMEKQVLRECNLQYADTLADGVNHDHQLNSEGLWFPTTNEGNAHSDGGGLITANAESEATYYVDGDE